MSQVQPQIRSRRSWIAIVAAGVLIGLAVGYLIGNSNRQAPRGSDKTLYSVDMHQPLFVQPLLSDGKSKMKFMPYCYGRGDNRKFLQEEPKDVRSIWVLSSEDNEMTVYMEKLPVE